MILYFGHVRGNREDEYQLAELTRLQACHAQIEPCTLAVDLGAERRKQQKLQQNVADDEYFPQVAQVFQIDQTERDKRRQTENDRGTLYIQVFR